MIGNKPGNSSSSSCCRPSPNGAEPVCDPELSAVNANVRHNVDRLRHAALILAGLVDRSVVGGVYDLPTGV
jgi:carbonic anhydrase